MSASRWDFSSDAAFAEVGRDSVEPAYSRSEANEVRIPVGTKMLVRAAPASKQGSTESRTTP